MTLPVDSILPRLCDQLASTPALVLTAEPGAGKSTRVPLALMAAPWCQGRVLLLEPRRLAARATASFMASSLGESLGQRVGLRTRMETRISAQTKVEVVTEGVLSRMLLADPALEGYQVIIFDEFHERSLQADLGLALARQSQQLLRPDLRLLIMSATLETGALRDMLEQAPVMSVEGRCYPVSVSHDPPSRRDQWLAHAEAVIRRKAGQGTVLVFLPGEREIRQLADRLAELEGAGIRIQCLYGQLSNDKQRQVLQPADPAAPRVVLSTAIAQTSVTLDNVSVVIDAGFERRAVFDPARGLTRLETVRLSRHTAEQRAGRAGRTAAGECVRLWPKEEPLETASPAEIRHADLTDLALTLAAWGCRDAGEMDWLDLPPGPAWQVARESLIAMGALDKDGGMTDAGLAMQRLPLPPRLARLQLAGEEAGCPAKASALAAILMERDPLSSRGDADVDARLHWLLEGEGRRNSYWQRQLQRLSSGQKAEADVPVDTGELLARAWPDRIAMQDGRHGRYRLADGQGACLSDGDPMIRHQGLVMLELQGRKGTDALCRLAAPFELSHLAELHPDRVQQHDRVYWDERLGRVRGIRETCFGKLRLAREEKPRPDPEQAMELLLDQVRQQGIAWLNWRKEDMQWRARVRWARKLFAGSWPDLSDEVLEASLDQWLRPWLSGIATRDQLDQLSMKSVLASLCPQSARELDQLLPTHFESADGRRWLIDYQQQAQPTLSLPVQALFGCSETPALAQGRLPLTLQLLSPARRPLAVTSDLASFWQQGWPQVRRDMRGRYPKHAWPEDPLSARPGARR